MICMYRWHSIQQHEAKVRTYRYGPNVAVSINILNRNAV